MQHTINTRAQQSTQQPLNNSHRRAVISLQICPGHRKHRQQRESVEELTALGLKGNIHAMGESTRQALFLDQETLQDFGLTPGLVEENITTEGIAFPQLELGQRLRVGSTVLHITLACSPGSQMAEIRPGQQDELCGRRGVFVRVLVGGSVSEN